MGIGMLFFIEVVGVGLCKDMDIFGLGMVDGCELCVYLMGKVVLWFLVQIQGQGYEMMFVQIVIEELGIVFDDIEVVYGDIDQILFGLGIYGSWFIFVLGGVVVLVVCKVCDKVKIIVLGMFEVLVVDLQWEKGKFYVKGDLLVVVIIVDIVMCVYGVGDLFEGIEGGLDVEVCYNLLNLIYLYGVYFCVVDIDLGIVVVKVWCFLVVDDCGIWINLMIIEGQVYGGIVDGIGMVLMEMIVFDEDGNCLGGLLMDYLILIVFEVLYLEIGYIVILLLYYLIGVKGIGELVMVGFLLVVVNVVVDVLVLFGVWYVDMLLMLLWVWEVMQGWVILLIQGSLRVLMFISDWVVQLVVVWILFVCVIVVWVQQFMLVCLGDEVILLVDGIIEGFVGGYCVQNLVCKVVMGVLQVGESVLLCVLFDGDVYFLEVFGVCVVVNLCLVGGFLEIFLILQLLVLLIQIYGEILIVDVLIELCGLLGYDVCCDIDLVDIDVLLIVIVIVSYGGFEVEIICMVLDNGVGYVGLVVSMVCGVFILDLLDLFDVEWVWVYILVGLVIGVKILVEIVVLIVVELIVMLCGGGFRGWKVLVDENGGV